MIGIPFKQRYSLINKLGLQIFSLSNTSSNLWLPQHSQNLMINK